MNAEEYLIRRDTLGGWPVRVISYRLGGRYLASVENQDPGARVSRGEGATREEAERLAVDKAAERLSKTRRR